MTGKSETTNEREIRLKRSCEANLRYKINQMVEKESDDEITRQILNEFDGSRCQKTPEEIKSIITQEKKGNRELEEKAIDYYHNSVIF